MFYSDYKERRMIVKAFIKNNPSTTYKEIKRKLHTKIEKVYSGGMGEAFRDAGVELPRTMKFKTKEERRRIIIDYIKKHPQAGGHTIANDTKINIMSVFQNTEEAFIASGVHYPREEKRRLMLRSTEEKKKKILEIIKKDPLINIAELGKRTHTHPLSLFKDVREIYTVANIKPIIGSAKIRMRKRNNVMRFVKENRFATQREINTACKTHVQRIFNGGIFEAYKMSGVKFPYERVNLHGITDQRIKKRATDFEALIASKLLGYGSVNRLVKTKRGFADVIFERKGKKAVFEVKDYHVHEISISHVKQLNKYLEDIGCNLGFLVCRRKPKKDKFLIGENRIFVLDSEELHMIPSIMGV